MTHRTSRSADPRAPTSPTPTATSKTCSADASGIGPTRPTHWPQAPARPRCLVTGLLPGSSLQVSGPAAGLTVLVAETVDTYGLGALSAVVLTASVLQIAMGVLRLGRWFRAISVSVVQGMLAGIGLILIAGQLYTLVGASAPASGPAKLTTLPELAWDTVHSPRSLTALVLGVATVALLLIWPRLPRRARTLPAPLAAVAAATAATALAGLDVARVEVTGLLGAVQPPGGADLARLADLGLISTVAAFTLIASAESLFSAAAVDRLHHGPRTDYNKELLAQGAGNAVCGLLGALPMTAAIVRSAANVQAGGRTKASRVLHGLWLLVFVALLPAVLGYIPIAALAAILIHAGCKLLPVGETRALWREHRGEALVLTATATAIVGTDMFEGVLVGLALAIAKAAWETSYVHLAIEHLPDRRIHIRITGNATFLRMPKILDALDALPPGRRILLDLKGLNHLDHACNAALTQWADRYRTQPAVPADTAG